MKRLILAVCLASIFAGGAIAAPKKKATKRVATPVFSAQSYLIADSTGTIMKEKGGDVWKFYSDAIYPYKGLLEQWYQDHQSFFLDLQILMVTAYVIISPKSNLPYRLFRSLPRRPF